MDKANKIRQPKQGRSIETKQKIISAGYDIFSSVGYYGTNTAEIAKAAGVSTGIIYGYFKDKRDILLCVLEIYINDVTRPILSIMENASASVDLKMLVTKIVDAVIGIHQKNARLHNTLHSLAATDEGVNARFSDLEKELTDRISERLVSLGYDGERLPEKVHFAMNVIQSFAHEFVFDNHDYIDYGVMRSIVDKTVVEIFE